ncbi:MAG: hypothetical protein IPM82_15265 [Saprospiraceae bacterium]|nr:hypothetical protein [Saprospiraceae bacterium]
MKEQGSQILSFLGVGVFFIHSLLIVWSYLGLCLTHKIRFQSILGLVLPLLIMYGVAQKFGTNTRLQSKYFKTKTDLIAFVKRIEKSTKHANDGLVF